MCTRCTAQGENTQHNVAPCVVHPAVTDMRKNTPYYAISRRNNQKNSMKGAQF